MRGRSTASSGRPVTSAVVDVIDDGRDRVGRFRVAGMSGERGAAQSIVQWQVAVHQAVTAVFDIASRTLADEPGLVEAFEDLEFQVGVRDPEAAGWMRRGLVGLLYAAARCVTSPGPGTEAAGPAPQEQVLRSFAATLPDEIGAVVNLARSAPLPPSLWSALGARRKEGPVPNDVLARAAVALIRNLLDGVGSSATRWARLGQVAGAAAAGACVIGID